MKSVRANISKSDDRAHLQKPEEKCTDAVMPVHIRDSIKSVSRFCVFKWNNSITTWQPLAIINNNKYIGKEEKKSLNPSADTAQPNLFAVLQII